MASKGIRQSRSQLLGQLRDQMELLSIHCATFDGGQHVVSKSIAVALRVLLHHTTVSHALLHQLGIWKRTFLDTASPCSSDGVLSDFCLILMQLGQNVPDWRAPLADTPLSPKWVKFADWWGEPVIKFPDTMGSHTLSRRDLVTDLTNMDGGAHVDPCLPEKYYMLSRENGLGWVALDPEGNETPLQDPVPFCIRQIAFEVMETIKKHVPQL